MISRHLEAEILRLYHAEGWRIGTLSRQLKLHRDTVRRVLAQAGIAPPLTGTALDDRAVRAVHPGDLRAVSDVARESPVSHGARTRLRGQRGSLPAHGRPLPTAAGGRSVPSLAHLAGEQGQVDWAHFGKIPIGRARGR
jgi:hypothetical protein